MKLTIEQKKEISDQQSQKNKTADAKRQFQSPKAKPQAQKQNPRPSKTESVPSRNSFSPKIQSQSQNTGSVRHPKQPQSAKTVSVRKIQSQSSKYKLSPPKYSFSPKNTVSVLKTTSKTAWSRV